MHGIALPQPARTRQLSRLKGRNRDEGEQAGPGCRTSAWSYPLRPPSSWSLSISCGVPSDRTCHRGSSFVERV